MKPFVSVADLAKILARLPRDEARDAVGLFGIELPAKTVDTSPSHEAAAPAPAPPSAPTATPEERRDAAVAEIEAARQNTVPSRFWCAERYDPAPPAVEGATVAIPPGLLNPLDESERGGRLFATPETPPLTRWRHLWPVLHEALRSELPCREPDVVALVRRWTRGEPVAHIPRRRRRAWAPRASLWIDASARLVPLWRDQEQIERGLRRVFGRSLRVRWLGAAAAFNARLSPRGWLAGERVDAATPVLVLGDLGVLGGHDAPLWTRAMTDLQREGARVTAVVPWSVRRHPRRVTTCHAVSWERRSFQTDTRGAQEAVDRLLALVSAALFVQPGLLRELRRLLPYADVETELRAWSHPAVEGADNTGLRLRAEDAAVLRARFAQSEGIGTALQRRVSEVIRCWHERMPREFVHAETLLWRHGVRATVAPPGDERAALAFVARLGALLDDPRAPERASWWQYTQGLLDALPVSAQRELPALARLRDAVQEARAWALRQVGDAFVVSPAHDLRWPSDDRGPGSPVAVIEAVGAEVNAMIDGVRRSRALARGVTVPLREGADVALRNVGGTLHLATQQREPWASAMGRDEYGLWAEVRVEDVAFRLRWISPGRFVMGSPEGEAGRRENEGPQHEVVLTRGYWLGETAVTQGLWAAVMGTNPSRFKSPMRPVETVSWDDCQEFINRLNRRVSGLGVRLPTEAEWEHGCRAGTTTATWRGDLVIEGRNHAKLLDGIAWYGGNSGVEFELANGYDSGGWPEKQYPHTRAGTHPVGQKGANPWGLYDMLGNVWEWCVDWYGDYGAELATNPTGLKKGSDRVLRGGSWFNHARYVRAAARLAILPVFRFVNYGFRLARGQSALQPVVPQSPQNPQ